MDLAPALALLRRRWIVALACLLIGIGAGAFIYEHTAPTYRSTARVFFNLPSTSDVAAQAQGFQLTTELLQSYARIATSQSAAQAISQRLNGALSASDVQSRVTATPEPQTLLLDVAATGKTPGEAQQLAGAATDNLVKQISQLSSVQATQIEPQVVDPANISNTPVSPSKKIDFGLGIALGVIGGVLAALLADALDRRIRTAKQATELTKLPELGRSPRSRRLAREPLIAWRQGPGGDIREAFRSLRTSVHFLYPDSPAQVILVTSPATGDGKTTVALNLAVALGASGDSVVLVDADLRRAGLTRMLSLDRAGGLTAAIRDPSLLPDLLQSGPHVNVQVLSSGALPPDPAEMLGSLNMASLLQAMAEHADKVILDCSPVIPVTDAVTLSTQVDTVVLVVREKASKRAELAETVRRLQGVGARLAGFVLNGAAPQRGSRYVYGSRRVASMTPSSEAPD